MRQVLTISTLTDKIDIAMGFNDINIKVSGGSDIISTLQTYTTRILKPNIVDGKNVLTQEMLSSKNTKYVIKYVYELLDTTLTMPQNVILEFDGGSIKNGTLVGNNTLMLNTNETESVLDNVTLDGTWKESSYDLVEEVVADKAPGDGMGRIVLRKDKTFAEQLTQENTIYVIRYDFELTEDVTIPANCILQFEGGSIGGTVTITFNKTLLIGEPKVYTTCTGEIENDEVIPDWFTDNVLVANMAIHQAVKVAKPNSVIKLVSAEYLTEPLVFLRSNITICSNNNAVVKTAKLNNYKYIFGHDSSDYLENVIIRNITFDQRMELSYSVQEQIRYYTILIYSHRNVTIEDCTFYACGTNAIVLNGYGENAFLIRNKIYYDIVNITPYDTSAIYVDNSYHVINENYIDGKAWNTLRGGIETHGPAGYVCNNTIKNVHVAVNIVGSEGVVEVDDSRERVLSGNTVTNTRSCFLLWPYKSHIRNVKITNNICIDVLNAFGTYHANNDTIDDTVKNIFISDNTFLFQTYTGELSDSTGAWNNWTMLYAVCFLAKSIVDEVYIERNYFKNVNLGIYTGGVFSGSTFNNHKIVLRDNTFDNIMTYVVRSDYYHSVLCALFMPLNVSELVVKGNVIKVSSNFVLKKIFTSTLSTTVEYSENTIISEQVLTSDTVTITDENSVGSTRPNNPTPHKMYFDTTLNKPIYWTGTTWVDATGQTV